MSNDDLLSEFLDDSYFKSTLTLVTKTTIIVKGRVEETGEIETEIDGIIQNIASQDLINQGLGQYANSQHLINQGLGQFTDKLCYSLFIKLVVDKSKNNFIRFENKLFKIEKVYPWNNYGFNKYIICQYNDEVLNDN
jgi:hypothetical protein